MENAMSAMEHPAPPAARALVQRLRDYLLPGGEEAARLVRGIRAAQRGEIRSSADARWIPFTAEEVVDATRSAFSWDARVGGNALTSVVVTDAYENGHGRLVVKKGPLTLTKMVGPDVDRGELQRYLGYVSYCPPMLLNHPTLEWTAIGPFSLRLQDRQDPGGTSVDVEIDETGRPVVTRAQRPMTTGKRVTIQPWSAAGGDEREYEGLRIATHLEASWDLPEGSFVYIRMDLTSFVVVR
jgi:hypothetical protein